MAINSIILAMDTREKACGSKQQNKTAVHTGF